MCKGAEKPFRVEKLEAACKSAKRNPAKENLFQQVRICHWVKQAVRWMPMEKWDQCAFAVKSEDSDD